MPQRKALIYLLLATLLLPFTPFHGAAQTNLSHMELGLNGGGMNYMGDLNNQSILGKANLAGGAFFRMQFNDRWALNIGGSYGHLEGGNPDFMAWRNLSFKSHLLEGTLRMEFNFWPYGLFGTDLHWTPFIFGGFGFFTFNPMAQWQNPNTGETDWYELQPLGTEGQGLNQYPDRSYYSLLQVNMPFGIGVKMMPSKSVTIAMEYGFRKTWTDYLDDVSTTYIDLEALRSSRGEVAVALSDRSAEAGGVTNAPGIKRGDDSLNDWYSYFNISVSVSFDILFGWLMKKKCD